jgi:medium-chain acyl-[acyl-carrier-protein] hydrolase
MNPWLACYRANPQAKLRLFCFANAGGGASAFRSWAASLPAAVEVCPVQLPGRESRLSDPPFVALPPLVRALAQGLRPQLDKPFAFLGHSMGALVGFELARFLRRYYQLEPLHFFVAGRPAPQLPRTKPPIHGLPDAEFRDELRRMNGTPAAVLDHDELMQLILPALRADFTLCETYQYAPEAALACPISAFGGLQDATVSRQDLEAWRDQTTGRFVLRMFPGDHFFLHAGRALFLEVLARDLQNLAAGPAPPSPGPTASAANSSPPDSGRLNRDEVHVWCSPLDQPPEVLHRLSGLLAAEERDRAERYYSPTDRNRYLAGRGLLRTILGRYLRRDPGSLRFAYNPQGKPFLASETGAEGLRFNVAHSHGLALYAISRGREVGVDLERMRPECASEEIAERFFSAEEVLMLRGLAPDVRREAFFRCWTRKEAYLKAMGKGLSFPLDAFAVSLAPGEPARLLSVRDDPEEVWRWSLHDLNPGADYVGALAAEGQHCPLRYGQWTPAESLP